MKKQVMFGLLLMILLISIGSSLSSDLKEPEDYLPGEILIKYKEGVVIEDKQAIKELAIWEGAEEPDGIDKVISSKELYNLKFDSDVDVLEAVEEYELLDDVEYAEPNYIMYTFDDLIIDNYDYNGNIYNDMQGELSESSESLNVLEVNKNLFPFQTPNDADYPLQWGLPNINAEQAWNLTTGDSSVIIAIIDTGVDWDHPDLLGNIWNNTYDDCDNSTDDDGNGYVDDCRGYDFVNVASGCTDNDCLTEDNDPMDFQGHGTHCTGIAGAVSNNNLGVTGVCWNCTIMPIRAGYKATSGQGSLAVDDVVQALAYATINNATIISMSFGGSHSNSIDEAINDSYINGSILVASAGNDGENSKQYPCAYDNVICIGSIDSDNTSASHSNYGGWVNLAAPGSSIRSTYYNDTYTSLTGTSMATPMVAGAIGLIVSLFNQNQTQVKTVLNNTGSLVNFTTDMISRINVYSALLSLDNTAPSIGLISPVDNHINLSVNQSFSCNASDWQLANLTLEIWNSTGSKVYNQTKEISSDFNVTNFNVTNLNQDTYQWNCLGYDAESNFAYASSNFTLIMMGIETLLISPTNNTYTTINDTNFTCQSLSENIYQLTNVSFYLWNYTGILIFNQSMNISNFDNSTQFNYTFQYEQRYRWSCLTFNNLTSFSWADNYTMTFDITNPNITLISPANSASYTSNSQSITFSYNISDNFEIANCSLIVGGVNLTNSSVSASATNNFIQSFSPGTYNWNINCSDKANNPINSSLRSFTVTALPPVTTASSGGGGGSGTPVARTYIPSSQQVSEGYTKILNQRDKIKFFDEKQEKHTLSIKEILSDSVTITIESNPVTLKLGIGQSAKLNLTSLDYYDLYIKLESIENNKAELTIQIIKERILKPTITGEDVLEIHEEEPVEEPREEIIKLKTIIYILVIIIIIIMVLFLFLEKRHAKNWIKTKESIKRK